MSTVFTVYVGPFLKVSACQDNDRAVRRVAERNDAFTVIDADSNDDIEVNTLYLLPNQTRDHEPDRATRFSRERDSPVIDTIGSNTYVEAIGFYSDFIDEIKAVQAVVPTAEVGWGVVPYWM